MCLLSGFNINYENILIFSSITITTIILIIRNELYECLGEDNILNRIFTNLNYI